MGRFGRTGTSISLGVHGTLEKVLTRLVSVGSIGRGCAKVRTRNTATASINITTPGNTLTLNAGTGIGAGGNPLNSVFVGNMVINNTIAGAINVQNTGALTLTGLTIAFLNMR